MSCACAVCLSLVLDQRGLGRLQLRLRGVEVVDGVGHVAGGDRGVLRTDAARVDVRGEHLGDLIGGAARHVVTHRLRAQLRLVLVDLRLVLCDLRLTGCDLSAQLGKLVVRLGDLSGELLPLRIDRGDLGADGRSLRLGVGDLVCRGRRGCRHREGRQAKRPRGCNKCKGSERVLLITGGAGGWL